MQPAQKVRCRPFSTISFLEGQDVHVELLARIGNFRVGYLHIRKLVIDPWRSDQSSWWVVAHGILSPPRGTMSVCVRRMTIKRLFCGDPVGGTTITPTWEEEGSSSCFMRSLSRVAIYPVTMVLRAIEVRAMESSRLCEKGKVAPTRASTSRHVNEEGR